jgi:hypothetical protein
MMKHLMSSLRYGPPWHAPYFDLPGPRQQLPIELFQVLITFNG